MKRVKILLVAFFSLGILASTATAQSDAVRSFAKKFRHKSGVQHYKIGGWLVRLGANAGGTADENIEKIRPFAENLDNLRVLIFDEKAKQPSSDDLKKLVAGLRAEHFEDLMVVRDGKERVNIMIRTNKSGSKIYDLVILVNDNNNETVILELEGEFKTEDIQKLMENGDISFGEN